MSFWITFFLNSEDPCETIGLEETIRFLIHLRCEKYKNAKKRFEITKFILWVQGIPI